MPPSHSKLLKPRVLVEGYAYVNLIRDSERPDKFDPFLDVNHRDSWSHPTVALSVEEISKLPIVGRKIMYNHNYDYGPIGQIISYSIEGRKLKIIAEITDELVVNRIKNGTIGYFSINYNASPRTRRQERSVQVNEVSVTEDPHFKDCVIKVRASSDNSITTVFPVHVIASGAGKQTKKRHSHTHITAYNIDILRKCQHHRQSVCLPGYFVRSFHFCVRMPSLSVIHGRYKIRIKRRGIFIRILVAQFHATALYRKKKTEETSSTHLFLYYLRAFFCVLLLF